MMAAIFAAAIWPMLAPPELATPALQNWTAPKRGRIYSMPAELEKIGSLQTAIARLFPKGRYEDAKGRYSYPSVFESDTGWNMDLFSYERDHAEAAGPNIGLQGFNEPPPEPLFKEAVARTRAGGYIIGGFTSLLDNIWVVDGIFGKADGKNIRVRFGNSCENCKTHGKNGNLDHDQIEKVLGQYDPDEREARFTGKPLVLSGRIFKGFDRNVHVAKEPIVPPSHGVTHGMAIDPAVGKPFAMVWWFVGPDGVINYYDEYPGEGMPSFEGSKDSGLSLTDYCELIKRKEQGRVIETRLLDRHFGAARRSVGGKTFQEELSDAGVDCRSSYSMDEEIETGIGKVKEMLRWNKDKPLDSINRPRILVSPTCRNLIASLERWGRNPATGKPTEPYKDFADVLRYSVMSNPEHEVERPWNINTGGHYGVHS